MKLIVNISEDDYNNIEPFLNGETIKGGFNLFIVLEIIKNGTPLDAIKDTISREEAINLITDYDLSMDQLVKGLHNLPPVIPTQNWIPCNKRPPQEGKSVIASTKYIVYPEARYTKEDGWEWAYASGEDYWEEITEKVEAWMPLPHRYEAGSEEVEE